MSLKERFSERWKPFERSIHFWIRATDIYAGYKICQFRTRLVRDAGEQEAMWERQHEIAAEKMYCLCSELGGLFLKAAQIFGKPDLAPAAWVRRLVPLFDRAPETPFKVVQQLVEEELGKNLSEVFEQFDAEPVGSASIAQVHRARLRHAKTDVAVKVQHPGVELLMIVDIHNLQALAKFLQKEIKFDLFSLTKEVEKQEGLSDGVYPWNSYYESWTCDSSKWYRSWWQGCHSSKTENFGKSDTCLWSNDFEERFFPCRSASRKYSYLQGFKDKNPSNAVQCYRELGIETLRSEVDAEELLQLAMKMFDTKLPRGMTVLSPFSEESSLKKVSIQHFPEELFSVLRTMQLLRGLSVGMGISYSCAEQWRPLAEDALYRAGRLKDDRFTAERSGFLRRIFRRGKFEQ